MRSIALLVISCLLLACIFASLPKRSSLRFQEVTEDILADNSVGQSKLKVSSVDTRNLREKSITAEKINDAAIFQRHLSDNSVTSGALAIDIVHLRISSTDNLESTTDATWVQIPDYEYSVQPYENVQNETLGPIADNPNPSTAYRVRGKARGPGTILGWYPALNGHMLRYQSSRALRTLTCADTGILSIGCACDLNVVDTTGCSCSIDPNSIIWTESFTCADCTDPFGLNLPDPQCALRNPETTSPRPLQPDRCISYTSVEDVANPQEGTPVYSPSVESIEIDSEGQVTLSFFGRGTAFDGFIAGSNDPDIDVVVIVLLDQQIGA